MAADAVERDELRARLLERYAPMLRRALAKPARSNKEQMVLLRERMANALTHLEAPTTPVANLLMLDGYLGELKTRMDTAENRKYAPQPAQPGPQERTQPQQPPAPLPTPKPASPPPVIEAATEDAADTAPAPSLLSIMEGAKLARRPGAEYDLLETLRNIMYTHGDAAYPLDASVRELLEQLRAWLARVLPHVTTEAKGPAPTPTPEAGASHPSAPAADTGGVSSRVAVELSLARLSAAFPQERARYSALLASRKRVERSTSEDEEQLGVPFEDGDLIGDGVENDEAGEADTAAAADGGAAKPPPARRATDEQRQALADERTRQMGLKEYDDFSRRRKASCLGNPAFAQWCAATFELKCGRQTRARVPESFSFLGWLARWRAAEIVEEANRAIHGGQMQPLRGPPISCEAYAAAARKITSLAVGRDREAERALRDAEAARVCGGLGAR
jgi:hypothetical protein